MKKHWLFTTLVALALCVICFVLFPAEAKAASADDLTFTLNNDGQSYAVTDCDRSASGELEIPSTYDGLPVTSIGDDAFSFRESLSSIKIPDGVTSIGDGAFFYCRSLTSITIPDSVTSIGDEAFSSCSSLTGIWVSEKNPNYSSDTKGVFFNKDKTTLIFAPVDISGSYTIPESVTNISDKAFCDCSSLTSITIPDGVTSIGRFAFSGCDSLTGITIPDSVTSIGSSVFHNCDSLTSITIPDSVTSIDDYAFSYCDSLTSITIPDSVTSIGNSAFEGCRNLTNITIPDGVTSIGSSAFEDCRSLTSITIPDSLTSIGDGAFFYCSSLTSITIPDSVTSIGWYAFADCDSLTSITIPDSVTSIGDKAFSYCDSLTGIWVSEKNPNYSSDTKGVFFNKDKTTLILAPGDISGSYTIPESVTNISDEAFCSCSSLTSITIPESVTNISDEAFCGCSSLTSITIPDSVTSIGPFAFSGCDSLTSITIPDSVTSICVGAFYDCYNLTSIIIPDNVIGIDSDTFYGCDSLTSITIPDSVISIGYGAFNNCSSLTDVYYDGTEAQWTQISIEYGNDYLTGANIHFVLGTPVVKASNAVNGVKITWNSVAGAANYKVYKSVYTNGAWSSWTAIKTGYTGTSYTDTTVKSGHNVRYTVRAFNGSNSSAFKASNSIKFLATPTVKASNAVDSVKLTWNAVGSAKSYIVYKSTYTNGAWSSWTRLKTGVTGTSYTDTTVKSADNVRYTVKAINGNFTSYIKASNSIKFLATPTVKATNAAKGVAVTWNKITGAKSYIVYKSVYSGGKWSAWTAIKTGVTGTTYTDTSVKSNDNVRYTVKAINGSFTSNIKASSSIKYLAAPAVTVSNATNGVKITWNAVSGAKNYKVYKSVYSGGKWSAWTAIKTGATGTTYTDTSVKSNANVKYTVRAFNGNFSSTYKSSSSIKFLATPTVTASNAANGVKITWNKITGAKSYIVYKSVYSGGKWGGWTRVATGVTGTSYTDTTVKSGANVRYTVKAINGNFTSYIKTSNSIKFLATPTVKVAKATTGIKTSWNAVGSAKGYIVYRRTYTNGKWSGWTAIKTTTATSFTDTTAKTGVYYQYTVRAYNGNFKGWFVNSASIKR